MQNIEVKELTVKQVKEVLNDYDSEKPLHVVDLLFPDSISAAAVSASTGLTLEELEGDFTVSEMETLIKKVKEKNPFFLSMIKRLAKVGEQMLQAS